MLYKYTMKQYNKQIVIYLIGYVKVHRYAEAKGK